MAESSLTDFATSRFAAEEACFAADSDPARRGILLSTDVGAQGPVPRNRFDGLTTAPERPTTVDDALAARSGAVRR
jgi:hypothetical protein